MTPNSPNNRTSLWKNIRVAPTAPVTSKPTPVPSARELREAATRFDQRLDEFAQGKFQTCVDLAAKLERFGDYASEKQQQFAAKLVEWSKPRERQWNVDSNTLAVPRLFSVMQRLADLYIGQTKISRKNQDSLCWVLNADMLVGKIEEGKLIVFPRKAADAGCSVQSVVGAIRAIEENPLEAAKAAGRASGRCAICGRDLTEPGSIEAGIGPVCAGKFGG